MTAAEDKNMAIIPLKCPKCGVGIQLDDQQETGTCQNCGSQFPFREAVQKYMGELAGKLMPDAEASPNPVVFTSTTTTINGKTTVNGQDVDLNDVISKVFGEQSGAKIMSTEPIPGYDLAENAVMAIRFLVARGQKIQAIKVFRQFTNADLKESKDVIDRLSSEITSAGASGKNNSNTVIRTAVTNETLSASNPPSYTPGNSMPERRENDPNIKSSRCYIATAVYGSYDAPEVRVLRRFRDEVLSRSLPGRAFIRVYYTLSPPVARRLQKAGRLNRMVRGLLDKLVRRLD